MKYAFDNLVQNLELLVQQGRAKIVSDKLCELNNVKIPRKHILDISNIARRINDLNVAFRLLSPIVRPTKPIHPPASSAEKALYAAILIKLGSTNEAFELLNTIDQDKTPEVMLYRAHALIYQWRYREAIPILKRYINSSNISEYQRLMGQINLAASYVSEGHKKDADLLLSELKEHAINKNLHLLHGNILELQAQRAINEHDFGLAEKYLDEGCHRLNQEQNQNLLHLRKWRAILNIVTKANPDSGVTELAAIQSSAIKENMWETVRECDFFKALALNDEQLFLQVYFGTPYKKYRLRIKNMFAPKQNIPSIFFWNVFMHTQPNKKIPVFDLMSGREINSHINIPAASLLHNLLIVFCEEFTRSVCARSFRDPFQLLLLI